MANSDFDSAKYWCRRYEEGGTSGAGSFGRLATYKAHFLNAFIQLNGVRCIMDLGCGDGNQLALFQMPRYFGLDVSEHALSLCRKRYGHLSTYSFHHITELEGLARCDATISLDVIFHLTDEKVLVQYIRNLFTFSERYCIVYSSNSNNMPAPPHIKHWAFTDLVSTTFPYWRLAGRVPNPYPATPSDPDNTSFADFFVYAYEGNDCVIPSPSAR